MSRIGPQRGTAWTAALLLAALAGVFACIAPMGSRAHDAGTTGHATVSIDGRTVQYELKLSAEGLPDTDELVRAVIRHVTVEANGMACEGVPAPSQPASAQGANRTVVVLYACPARVEKLRVRNSLDSLLGEKHHTITDFRWAGGATQLVFESARREAEIAVGDAKGPSGAEGDARGTFLAYLHLGIEHILLGYDHVLFVLALILPGGTIWSLLAIVTAFTVAHSITLALSVLGIVTVPGEIVEPIIALSIAYVAFENLFSKTSLSRRWGVSFAFGLVHGFGFAGALAEVGLPAEGLATALVGFNLGVEAGQALIVAVAVPLLASLRRFSWQPRAVHVASAMIMVVGLGLVTQRVLLG